MSLTAKFLAFTLLGATWVLWLLVGLSVLSVAVMIERALFFARMRVDLDRLLESLRPTLRASEPAALERWIATHKQSASMEETVAREAMRELPRGPEAVAEVMVGVKARERVRFERYLGFLATLGNNAPFIGLFGTVIGIIKAFHELGLNQTGGATVVMAGISEALVATAIGLLVALPAVIAHNVLHARVRQTVANTDAVAHFILGELKGRDVAALAERPAAE